MVFLSGKFTPTEASGVAVAYAFILSVFIYGTIKLSEIPKLLVDAAVMTTIVMLIIGASSVLSFVMSFTGLPAAISKLVLGISSNKYVILLILNIFLLIVGTFMDMAPALFDLHTDLPSNRTELWNEPDPLWCHDGYEPFCRNDHTAGWKRTVCGMQCGKTAG